MTHRTDDEKRPQDPAARPFDLQVFMPYRIAALADAVSRALAQLYAERFDLSRQEWRILAHLGSCAGMTAKKAGEECGLDKMQVSRAVRRLEQNGYLERRELAGDRRNNIVSLTRAGKALYCRITPLALERERFLMAGLSPAEIRRLSDIMAKLQARAEYLMAQDAPGREATPSD